MANNLDRRAPQQVVLRVRQGLAGRNHDAVPGVDPQRVEVLHVAHRDAVVLPVPDHLVLDLLPALETLLHEHLRGHREGPPSKFLQRLWVVREPGAQASQRERRAKDDGVANLLRGVQSLLHAARRDAGGNLRADLLQLPGEQVTVLRDLDGPHRGSQDLHSVPLQNPGALQLNPTVQRGLATKRQQNPIRTLLLDHALDEGQLDGEEVDLVRHAFAGLHSGDVGVDQHRLDLLLLQRLDGLAATVVKLAGLPDGQPSRAQDQHLSDVPHWWGHGHDVHLVRLPLDHVDEVPKKVLRVCGSRCGFGVELHAEEGLEAVDKPLVGLVIRVDEELLPVGGKGVVVHRKAVVLRCDVAVSRSKINAGLVHPSIAVLHLVSLCTCCQSKKLVSQADPKDRLWGLQLQSPANVFDGLAALRGVPGAVGDEETLPLLGEDIVVPWHHLEMHLVGT
eukprot:RCo053333